MKEQSYFLQLMFVLQDISSVLEQLFYSAPSDLQPYYGNGYFGSVYILYLNTTKR